MPELPEVETVRRGLANLLPGRTVLRSTTIDSPKSFPNAPSDVEQFLYEATIVGVRRRAKVLIIDLSSEYSLVVHLKMTGQLVFRLGRSFAPLPSLQIPLESARRSLSSGPVTRSTPSFEKSGIYSKAGVAPPRATRGVSDLEDFAGGHPSDSLVGELPDRSTRVEISFDDGSRLFFNDQRKFGWIKLVPTTMVEQMPFFQKVGPEPLDPKTKSEEFTQRVRRRSGSMIKPVILDQAVIAGVGNIYADECLWAAHIHPETRSGKLSDEQLNTLFIELVKILQLSIDQGGSTDRNYVDAEGRKGNYLKFANVFRREGQACHRHPDQEILKIRVAGRGTHICPVCQVVIV